MKTTFLPQNNSIPHSNSGRGPRARGKEMDYSNGRDLTENEKSQISSWLKEALLEYMDECDDVFLEYVMVMILNGKSMSEISADLEAFIGEPACSELALR
jgi:hypothetical protein